MGCWEHRMELGVERGAQRWPVQVGCLWVGEVLLKPCSSEVDRAL